MLGLEPAAALAGQQQSPAPGEAAQSPFSLAHCVGSTLTLQRQASGLVEVKDDTHAEGIDLEARTVSARQKIEELRELAHAIMSSRFPAEADIRILEQWVLHVRGLH